MGRYSFVVGLFPPRLSAGLSRRFQPAPTARGRPHIAVPVLPPQASKKRCGTRTSRIKWGTILREMAKRKPKTPPQPRDLPPGVRLLRVLREPDTVFDLAWSPDGRSLISANNDGSVGVWEWETSAVRRALKGHSSSVKCVAVTPDGKSIISGGNDAKICVRDLGSGEATRTLEVGKGVDGVALTSQGRTLIAGCLDDAVQVWDLKSGKRKQTWRGHEGWVRSVAVTPDGQLAVSGSEDNTVRVWDVRSGKALHTLEGHVDSVWAVAIAPDGRHAISGGSDKTIRIWDLKIGRSVRTLEGHTESVRGVATTPAGQWIGSCDSSGTVHLWEFATGRAVGFGGEAETSRWVGHAAAFHPNGSLLATRGGEEANLIHIWEIDFAALRNHIYQADETVPYTTARLALVGDSGVGKSGLGWLLAHNEYKEHDSTHGQRFWVIDELCSTLDDGTVCEAVLWDLAGQPDYRLVHALFLDEVDLGLLLFDPSQREQPLSGVEYWLKQLQHAEESRSKSRPQRRTILVGARIDRGSATLTDDELNGFCRQHGIRGEYIATSAKQGTGIDELKARIRQLLTWQDFSTTVTTKTFKRVKDYVLRLKESAEEKRVLVTPAELRGLLQAEDEEWQFSDDEMMTAVDRLADHGYVTRLRQTSGEESILLAPDLLTNLASSMVLEARRHPRGFGLLEEAKLLAGEYPFGELDKLEKADQGTLLDAAARLFVRQTLCFRESVNDKGVLIFPSLINEKRPSDAEADKTDDVSYRIIGAVENVYASLVVQLGYTNAISRDHHWQKQAQFEMGEGQVCGFRRIDERQGEIELVLYYDRKTLPKARTEFQETFEWFLSRCPRVEIECLPVVDCPKCKRRQQRNVVLSWINEKQRHFFCNGCGKQLQTPKAVAIGAAVARAFPEAVERSGQVALARTKYEEALSWVKSFRHERGDEAKPSCFISYAWGTAKLEKWVLELAKDLRAADIDVIFDRWASGPGKDINRFIQRIDEADFVAAVGTAAYLKKYKAEDQGAVVAAELGMITTRLGGKRSQREGVMPLLRTGTKAKSFPALFGSSVHLDFRKETTHFARLFELILAIHKIPLDRPQVEEFRAMLTPERGLSARASAASSGG